MAQLETKLVATLVDRISGPATKAASALKNAGAATKGARGKAKVSGGEFDLAGTIEKRARERNISQLRAYISLVQEITAKSRGKVRLSDLIADKEFLLRTTNLIDGLKELDQIIAETRKDYKGFMDEQLRKRLESWESKLNDLSNAFAALNTTIGNALAPALARHDQNHRMFLAACR
jgi:hypothetical protein